MKGKIMKNILKAFVTAVTAGAVFTGCGNQNTAPVELKGLECEYFIQKLELGTTYIVPDETGEATTTLMVEYKKSSRNFHISYGERTYTRDILRPKKNVVYFCHSSFGNALYFYEHNEDLKNSCYANLELSKGTTTYSTSRQITFAGDPSDPSKIECAEQALGAGPVVVSCEYRVIEHGNLEEIPSDDGFRYACEGSVNPDLTLRISNTFLVYDSKDAKEGKMVEIPAGTHMVHYRIKEDSETNTSIEDLLLDDGRIVRIKCCSMFSEPHPYYVFDDSLSTKVYFEGARDY